MAKKRPKKTTKKTGPKGNLSDKVRVDIRLDPEIHEKLVAIVEDNGISINQLMNGLAEVATRKMIPGKAQVDPDDVIRIHDVPKCFWLGFKDYDYEKTKEPLCMICQLDFRGRVIPDEHPVVITPPYLERAIEEERQKKYEQESKNTEWK